MKFVIEVKMKPGFSVEEYAQGWVEASTIIQRNPGARGTYLHRKIGAPDTVLAIAHWDSKAARDQKNDDASETVRQILQKHTKHCEITVLGDFEEPEWVVLPPTSNQ